MKILYTRNGWEYFDKNGTPLYEGDVVIFPSGAWRILYRTEDGKLGTDATNRQWIVTGKAEPCQFGIYPLEELDIVEKCPFLDKYTWFSECCINMFNKVHFDENGNYTGNTLKLAEIIDDLLLNKAWEAGYAMTTKAMHIFIEKYPDIAIF